MRTSLPLAPSFSVIYDDEGQKLPILALIGVTVEGLGEVIAFTVGERENQGAWENLLSDIKARGVEEVGLWITDGHRRCSMRSD